MIYPQKNNDAIFNGFTLLNLILTLAIMGILATIALPTIRRYQPSLQLKAAGRNFIADIRYAQELTVSEQSAYYVAVNASSSTYYIAKQSEPESPIKTVDIKEGIFINESSGFTDNKIIFNSYGSVSQPGTITLINSQNQTLTITIKPSGYVRLEE